MTSFLNKTNILAASVKYSVFNRNNENYATIRLTSGDTSRHRVLLSTANIGPERHNEIHLAAWRFVNFDWIFDEGERSGDGRIAPR